VNLTPADLAEIRGAVRELESYGSSALANGKTAVAKEITEWINNRKRTIVFVEDRENKERAITNAQKLISSAVKNKEISREKAEELLINLETGKITPESIKAMFGELQ
jgi:Lhr-like helicase